MKRVFLAPHPDDETLFGTFTLLRHRPLVICVLDCGQERAAEFEQACDVLDVPQIRWEFPEKNPDWEQIGHRIRALDADALYAPAWVPDGNPQHSAVAEAARGAAPNVARYLTYTPAGKQTDGTPVAFELPWIGLKLRALGCYPSQFSHPSHAPHFLRDQTEYRI
jgi:LmbE family N-acetylglucosaminyl deacetylase